MNFELPQTLEQVGHEILVWVGFGTLVGLTAKGVMPGRDPGGAITTLLMGIGGSIIGSGILTYFADGKRVTPLSLPGFLVATGGAFVLLSFYRLLSGRFQRDVLGARGPQYLGRQRTRRRPRAYSEETSDL